MKKNLSTVYEMLFKQLQDLNNKDQTEEERKKAIENATTSKAIADTIVDMAKVEMVYFKMANHQSKSLKELMDDDSLTPEEIAEKKEKLKLKKGDTL